jgi:hypothetical protein
MLVLLVTLLQFDVQHIKRLNLNTGFQTSGMRCWAEERCILVYFHSSNNGECLLGVLHCVALLRPDVSENISPSTSGR